MSDANKKSRVSTYYEKEDTGKVVFTVNKDIADEIDKYVDILANLKKAQDTDPAIVPALDEIKFKLESLKYSELPADETIKKLKQLTRVPLGGGKFMHLSAFVSSTGEAKVVKTQEEYLTQVEKMIKNTMGNLTNLLIYKNDDEHLKAFFDELNTMQGNANYEEVKTKMDHLTMSGIIKHYNDIKLSFLKDWLAPFQEKLGKPADKMTPQEIQNALGIVADLKKKELDEVGLRIAPEPEDSFRKYNRSMHELMNGKSSDFWGFAEQRDEFVNLVQKAINRFSFKLENHYLIFEMADKTVAYLIGFPDDTFSSAKKLKDGKIGLIPHLKVFFKNESGSYKEVVKENVENTTQYYQTLRTAVVPFLSSLSMILDTPLSQEIRDAFDMWL
ncbi:hypothetical protein WDW89_13910 [Deltaproteobacteria bacterium TL4]